MEIEPRPLLKTDIPDVLEISKTTWDGHDHLPDVIESWLTDPDKHLFGIKAEGQIVSIGGLHIIDNGETGWMEGLRVHEDFRRRGLAKVMTDHIVKIAEELKIPRVRLVTASVSEAPMKLAQSVGMVEKLRFTTFWKSLVEQIEWSHQTLTFQDVDSKTFHEAMVTHKELLPHNILILHWDAFEGNRHNVEVVAVNASFWIGSKSSDVVSLSLGTVRQVQDGSEWCFTIYTEDPDAFKSTLSFHLGLAKEKGCNSILCLHDTRFEKIHQEIEWLTTVEFGFDLILYERIM